MRYICQINKNQSGVKEHRTKSMEDVRTILKAGQPASDIINQLKRKSVSVPSWGCAKGAHGLLHQYEPSLHKIANDKIGRKDYERADGHVEKASRIFIGLEKLLTKRMQEFMFAIPVKRIYHNTDTSDTRQEIAKAIEAIYKHARIDAENTKRARAYFASCEVFTLWYLVESPNDLYGFKSQYKLKCRTFSPMDDATLYPLFDEYGDLVAMSYEYKVKVQDEETTFFETFTDSQRIKWSLQDTGWREEAREAISIAKIPGVYAYRKSPIWAGLSHIREDIEYTLSRNSDVVAYNAAPVLQIAGEVEAIEDENEKDVPYKVFKVENGGNVQYVSWNQGLEATKYHIDALLKFAFMQAQLPDISFDAMKSLGNIGFDARQTLLMDAHLKVGDESGAWIETFERETNVIKAFLKQMNTKWSSNDIDATEVEHCITPFVINDEKGEIQKWVSAAGGKQIISQKTAIKNANLGGDPDEEYEQIQQEQQAATLMGMAGVFEQAQ